MQRTILHSLSVVFGYALLFILFFAPVLFSAYLLAPGDGILYFLPNFYARRVLWDASVWGGFPAVGDSQLMMWYPPALLFSFLRSWDAFLLSAYVLAASFAYAYAYALTRSRFAATIGGVCYGMCGFFAAHLGHAALIHAAAWLPLFILSLEKLARPGANAEQREDARTGRDEDAVVERSGDAVIQRNADSGVERNKDSDAARRADAGSVLREDAGGGSHKDAGGGLHEDAGGVRGGDADVARGVEAWSSRRARGDSFWYAVGAASVACAALAGHPQIFVYMLALGGAYALVRGWRAGRRGRYYFLAALLVLNGTGLAAIQLLPTAELAALSLRAALGFAEFVSYALPLRQTPMLLFPYLFGGSPGTFYDLPYFGAWGSEAGGWGAGELSGYVGLLPLLLAATGFFATKRRALARFWLATCVVAFLLALGEATPLARLTYQLPFINKFRVPARHFMELSFAVSVLAALGAHAVLKKAASGRLLKRTLAVAACSMLACLVAILALTGQLNAAAAAGASLRPLSFLPWANAATGVPLLVLLACAIALACWHRRPHSFARGAILLFVLALDLASFSWFYEWHYGAPYKVFQSPPAAAVPLRDELAATHTRLLPVRGGTGRVSEIPPDLSKLWNFPSASGYGPFILTRVSRLLTMPPHGSVGETWRDPANLGLDMLAVRYLFVPRDQVEPPTTTDAHGIKWTQGEFNVSLGAGCGAANPDEFAVELPQAARANVVAVATALACSAAVPNGQEVARVVVTDTSGQTYTQSLLAGRDTSEWAYDCADVRPTLRQSRAPVYRSYPVTRPGDVRCTGHDYAARLALPANALVTRIRIQWTGGAAATLSLKKISLLDESEGRSVAVVPSAGSLADATRWRHVTDINFANSGYGAIKPEDVGEASVYENLRARPRAWLVGKVLTVSEEEALGALHSSRLADGSAFDPARVALVEEFSDFTTHGFDGDATARVTLLSDGLMEVETRASAPAFLVTSDVFYPGWEATVDGAPARVVRANYALRGLAVPAGTHTVRFEFRPRSFYRGAYVSAASLLLLAASVFWMKRTATRRTRPD